MKKTTTIMLPAGRILGIKQLEDGTYEVLLEVEDDSKEKETEKGNSKTVLTDSDLVLIEAENLSIHDEFMKFEPINVEEEQVKNLISRAIKEGVKNFYKLSGKNVKKGKLSVPAALSIVRKSYDWHEKFARDFRPKRNSRLGSRLQYGAYLGVLIKKLIEEGKTVEWAWYAVCCDYMELEKYWEYTDKNCDFEVESKAICGYWGLPPVYKVLAWEDECYWKAGGIYYWSNKKPSFTDLNYYRNRTEIYGEGYGWIVCS